MGAQIQPPIVKSSWKHSEVEIVKYLAEYITLEFKEFARNTQSDHIFDSKKFQPLNFLNHFPTFYMQSCLLFSESIMKLSAIVLIVGMAMMLALFLADIVQASPLVEPDPDCYKNCDRIYTGPTGRDLCYNQVCENKYFG